MLGFEGLYSVSDLGLVRSEARGGREARLLKPWLNRGYWQVGLCRPDGQRRKSVHTLVLEAFVGPRPDTMEARHLNGDKRDNRLVNLAWGTHTENIHDRFDHGTASLGEMHGAAKLTEAQAREILALRGRVPQRQIAARFGVSPATVAHIHTGRKWAHLTEVHRG